MTSASPRDLRQKARRDSAALLSATRFGLDLDKYPTAQIAALLDALPNDIVHGDEDVVVRLLSVCSVGETMFMRHPEQIDALCRLVAEGSVGEPSRKLAVWSAGCATGEEAYSLAAMLAARPGGVSVLGTDVSAKAIERARTGQYRYWSLRGMDPAAASDWLEVDALHAKVREPLRRHVEFRVQNLAGEDYPRDIDVVFCRNVLMYFKSDAAAAVIARFYESLRPGGVLFLGYVDPLVTGAAPFVEAWLSGVRYYRKPGGDARAKAPSASTRPPPENARLSRQTENSGTMASPLRSSGSEAEPLQDDRTPFEERLELARSLCGQGARAEALALLGEISEEHPLEVEPHVLAAMVADEADDAVSSLEAARRAYFLLPESPVTAFLLGTCLDRVGEARQAERRFAEALRGLDRVGDAMAPLAHGEGMTAYQLRRTIDARFQGK